MAYSLKINVFNNRDYEQGFTLTDGANVPRNLTGSKLIFTISVNGKNLTFDSSNVANKCIAVTNAATGQVKLMLPYSVLRTIPEGTYPHDMIIIAANGWRTGVWSGTINVKRGVGV